jgi:hypothetical protein
MPAATSRDPIQFFLRERVKILVLNDLLVLDRVRSAQNIEAKRVVRKILPDKGLAASFAGFRV